VAEEIASGKLRRTMRDWQAASMDVHVVFPRRKHVPIRERVFVDAVTRRFNPAPWRT